MNTSFIISAALLGMLSLLFGVFVYAKNKTSNVNKTWMILNFSASLWSWSLFARELCSGRETALFFVRLCYVGAIFIPPLFFHFVSFLTKRLGSKLILAFYSISLIFLIFNFTTLFIKDVRPILSFRYYGIPGIVFPFFVGSFIGITSYGHYVLFRYFRESRGEIRNQIRYLLSATIIGFLGGISTFLPVFNIEVFPFGFYLISVYVVIISYAIAKHRLMDINIVLKKGTTYILLLITLFVPSFLLILLGQKLFFFKISYLFTAIIVALLFLVTILFYRIKPQAERVVEQVLFKNRYDYRETLADFSKAMVSILDLQSLSRRIFETITQTMGVEKGSLFLWNEEKAGYSLFESKSIEATSAISQIPKRRSPTPLFAENGRDYYPRRIGKGSQ